MIDVGAIYRQTRVQLQELRDTIHETLWALEQSQDLDVRIFPHEANAERIGPFLERVARGIGELFEKGGPWE